MRPGVRASLRASSGAWRRASSSRRSQRASGCSDLRRPGTSPRCCAPIRHRRQRTVGVLLAIVTLVLLVHRGLRRGDRDRQHLRDRRRRPHPRIALLRLIGASARRSAREVARQGLVVGAIGALLGPAVGTALAAAAGSSIAGRMLPDVRLRLDRAGAARCRRRSSRSPPGRRPGRVAPRADGDARCRRSAASRSRTSRPWRAPGRNVRRDRALRRSAAACWPLGSPSGWSPARRGRRRSRRHPVVHRSRARRDPRHAAGAAARRPPVRPLAPPRGWRPRTRCAIPSARRAWRSAS